MLVLQRKVGESIVINDNITVTITKISGDKVKIGIDAPVDVKILRSEVVEVENNNKQAVKGINQSNFIQMMSKINNKKD